MFYETSETGDRLKDLEIYLKTHLCEVIDHAFKDIEEVQLLGCGTSYHSALLGELYLERFTTFHVQAIPASEFLFQRYGRSIQNGLLVLLSRSGETTEIVRAMREGKARRYRTLALTNNPESTLAREADFRLGLQAGDEKSVVMTKTFNAQVYLLQNMAAELGVMEGVEDAQAFADGIRKVPGLVSGFVRDYAERVFTTAAKFSDIDHFAYLAIGVNYPIVMEAALKLRETSYVAVEPYHALEFRHGPMAMVDRTLCILHVISNGIGADEHLQVAMEMASRGARTLMLSNYPPALKGFEHVVEIPTSDLQAVTPLLFMVPLQLFACGYSAAKGRNPDEPRHLSKVVILDGSKG